MPIRSFHVVGSKRLGGAERWVFRFVEGLAEHGQEPVLLVRGGSEVAGAAPPGVPVHRLPFRSVWDPFTRWGLDRLVRLERPQIVQTYLGRATRLTRIERRNGPVHVARLGGYYRLEPFRHAHAWIGNTLGICDYLVRNGMPRDRVFHVYNFVDPPGLSQAHELEALRDALGIGEEDYILLTPGRFVPVKGHEYLLQALGRLKGYRKDGRPWRLILLGDGPLKDRLQGLVRGLGLVDRVVFPGWRQDPGPFYQLADLVVFPSLEEETLGNVVLEAWSYGKPVVCTEFRGAMEITNDGQDVLRVPCRSPELLARAMATVMGDQKLAASLAENGMKRIVTDFDRKKILSRYQEIYEFLLRG